MSFDFKFVTVPSMPITVARIALGNAVAEDCCSVEWPKVDSQHRQSSQSSNGGNLARRRYQNGSLFLRGKNPVWVGRWLEDVMDVRGKITRLHKSEVIGTKAEFPSRRLARRELDIRLSRINSLTYRAQKIISFADLAERWKRSVMSNYKPSSQSGMKSTVNRWLTPRFGHLMVNEITTEMLQQFLSDAEVKPKTVRNLYITFKLIWGTAKAWGYAEKNICEGIVLPTMNDPIRKWFNPEQMKQIIVAAQEPYKTISWVDAECGIRCGELCALAGCGKTRFEASAVPQNSLVSTTQPDKKKVCVDKTSSNWMCSAT